MNSYVLVNHMALRFLYEFDDVAEIMQFLDVKIVLDVKKVVIHKIISEMGRPIWVNTIVM